MTAMTAAQIKQLDHSMEAAHRVGLGTRLAADEVTLTALSASAVIAVRPITSGCHTVTIAQISASAIVFSASSLGMTAITGYMFQPYRAGVQMTGIAKTSSASAVTVIPASSGSYIPVLNDALNYIIY